MLYPARWRKNTFDQSKVLKIDCIDCSVYGGPPGICTHHVRGTSPYCTDYTYRAFKPLSYALLTTNQANHLKQCYVYVLCISFFMIIIVSVVFCIIKLNWMDKANACREFTLGALYNPLYTLNPRVSVTRKRVHWGQTLFRVNDDRKSVNLTRNMTQSWVNLTPLFVKSAESWPNSWSLLTRNGVWPQWVLTGPRWPGAYCIKLLPEKNSGYFNRNFLPYGI